MLGRIIFFAVQRAGDACRRLAAASPSATPAPEHAPALLAQVDMWARATQPIAGGFTGIGRVQELHAAATDQIDAADYLLRRLTGELVAVMPMPADGTPLRAILARMTEAIAEPEPASKPASGKATLAA